LSCPSVFGAIAKTHKAAAAAPRNVEVFRLTT
jgi:hypothetical protein